MDHIDRAKDLRRRQTRSEAKLWHVRRNRQLNGWKFRRQCPIDRYIADFACIEANLFVEVDGATLREGERDAMRGRTIEACGFAILRITNAEIAENLDGVRETIPAAIERRPTL